MTGADRRHILVIVENVAAGVDTRLRKQLDDLLGAGYRVSVITMRHPDNEPYRHRPHLRLLEYPAAREASSMAGYGREYLSSFVWAAVLTARARRTHRIDVVHVCQPPDIYFPLCWVLRWMGSRIVVDQRDLMPEMLAARYADRRPPQLVTAALRWLERRTQRVAHHTVTVNDYLSARLLAAGAQRQNLTVVRNGPVFSRAALATPDRTLKGRHRHLVCWAGKMGRQDRVELVVRVAEHIVHEMGRHDIGFVVMGDGECLEDLRRLTAGLGLNPWVRFPGWLSEEEVFSYLATADVGLDTSLQAEVSPVKAMEYMAQGLAIVCFDLPETRRITAGAASLVQPGNTAGLAAEIIALLEDQERRLTLGCVGRERVRDTLAWEHQAPLYLAALDGKARSSTVRGG